MVSRPPCACSLVVATVRRGGVGCGMVRKGAVMGQAGTIICYFDGIQGCGGGWLVGGSTKRREQKRAEARLDTAVGEDQLCLFVLCDRIQSIKEGGDSKNIKRQRKKRRKSRE